MKNGYIQKVKLNKKKIEKIILFNIRLKFSEKLNQNLKMSFC